MAHPALNTIIKEINRQIDLGNLSTIEIANAADVTRTTMLAWLNSERNPTFDGLVAMGKAIGYKLVVTKG